MVYVFFLILGDPLYELVTLYALTDQPVTWPALSLTLARCKRFIEVESFVTHYLPEPHESVAIGCQVQLSLCGEGSLLF